MRYLLVLLALCWTARGANPSFGDFNSNQFATNGNKVAIKSGARLTNAVPVGTWTFDDPIIGNDTITAPTIEATSFFVLQSRQVSAVSQNGTNGAPNVNFTNSPTVTWARSGSNWTANATSSGDTTGTNIVTLTQTGTNISQMDFSLLQFGGAFKLSLTNNGYVGAPANTASSPFRKVWLLVQQPSTGTCLLQFTNGWFAWPEGVAPIVDTNNGSVMVFEFITDVFTNGLVHGSLTPLSKLATNM